MGVHRLYRSLLAAFGPVYAADYKAQPDLPLVEDLAGADGEPREVDEIPARDDGVYLVVRHRDPMLRDLMTFEAAVYGRNRLEALGGLLALGYRPA